MYNRFLKKINEKKQVVILALDEVDRLVSKLGVGDEILYNLTRLNGELDKAQLSIIGISNDLRFMERIDPRVKSSLSEEEIVFRPYDAAELQDILWKRAQIAFSKGILSSSAISLCAALAAAEHGDARRALDLLRVAGELVERSGAKSVDEKHVRQAERCVEHDRIVEILENLPVHSKLVLSSIYILINEGIKEPKTGEVFEIYNNLCNQINIKTLTKRRVSSLINELNITNILNTKVISLGRYGRTKKILLEIPLNTVKEIFLKDPLVSIFFKS